MIQLKCNVAKLAHNSLATRKLTTQTHCLECRVQVEFKNFTANTALHLSYDGHLCEEMLFQLKAMHYKALYHNNNLQSCPLVLLYMGVKLPVTAIELLGLMAGGILEMTIYDTLYFAGIEMPKKFDAKEV